MTSSLVQDWRPRVLKHHRTCGYCGTKLSKATALRRHISEAKGHTRYRLFLFLLDGNKESLSTSASGITDEWDRDKYNELERQPAAADIIEQPSSLDSNGQEEDNSLADPFTGKIDEDVRRVIQEKQIFPIGQCPDWIRELWESSGGVPKVIPSAILYSGGSRHTDESLFLACLNAKPANVQIFNDSVTQNQDAKSQRRDLITLAYKYRDGTEVSAPASFRVTASIILENDTFMRIPNVEGQPIPQDEDFTEIIWSPCGGVTEPHIDRGKKVVSSPVGPCRKMVFLWPSTVNNLQVMEKNTTIAKKAAEVCSKLEGGFWADLGEDHALIMPHGTVHMVETYVGGFIVTKAYIDSDTVIHMSRWLGLSPSHINGLDARGKLTIVEDWMCAAGYARIAAILEGWNLAAKSLLLILGEQVHQRKDMVSFWTSVRNQDGGQYDDDVRGIINCIKAMKVRAKSR
ncbi:hypothetical protein LTR37_018530 [Vermiconidia calcicola]|uniref:Uncharacterized protein n=1 Tax=Vermiconidia calcicola TaxID=1690605 RepID=A0ACC3MGN3_9PEZI|nr:hypothetical protein LTR37_018530 [Vermiconidia calcicola]